MLTSCVLITISLIPLSSVLAKNVTTQVDDLTAKGVALDRLGNHTGAIAYYDKVLAINATDTNALHNKGLALDRLGNHTSK